MPWVGDRQITETTVEDAAQTYVDVLSTRPNAWGRHQHPVYGDSGNVHYLMSAAFGNDSFDRAVRAEFASRREARCRVSDETPAPRM